MDGPWETHQSERNGELDGTEVRPLRPAIIAESDEYPTE
jgi:hypothetical protein